jgi:hypothetical protein
MSNWYAYSMTYSFLSKSFPSVGQLLERISRINIEAVIRELVYARALGQSQRLYTLSKIISFNPQEGQDLAKFEIKHALTFFFTIFSLNTRLWSIDVVLLTITPSRLSRKHFPRKLYIQTQFWNVGKWDVLFYNLNRLCLWQVWQSANGKFENRIAIWTFPVFSAVL